MIQEQHGFSSHFWISKSFSPLYQSAMGDAGTAAVFLDRDGTLIVEKQYLSDPEQLEFFAGVGLALRSLILAGFKLVVVTNQSGIGRGMYTEEAMHRVNARMLERLKADSEVRFEKIYFAPEAPGEPSRGRKPSPQFLFDARDELGVVLARSYLVGDKLADLECGWNAGVGQSILVRTGYGSGVEQECDPRLKNAVIVDDLPAAARWILEQGGC